MVILQFQQRPARSLGAARALPLRWAKISGLAGRRRPRVEFLLGLLGYARVLRVQPRNHRYDFVLVRLAGFANADLLTPPQDANPVGEPEHGSDPHSDKRVTTSLRAAKGIDAPDWRRQLGGDVYPGTAAGPAGSGRRCQARVPLNPDRKPLGRPTAASNRRRP